MNFDIEKKFVKEFIKKELQDRLIFELQSSKRREKALSRFSHNAENLFKNPFEICDEAKIKKHFDKEQCNKKCYVLSWDETDASFLSMDQALAKCFNSAMSLILIFDEGAIIKEEWEKSKANFFFLKSIKK